MRRDAGAGAGTLPSPFRSRLACRRLPVTVQAGLFVASPGYDLATPGLGGGAASHLTNATAVFGHVSLRDQAARGGVQ